MPDRTLQDIKDRLNVADVIAGYIPIRKAGANFKALCPFHHEKSPSLHINPARQIWHCFGCGEGGDIFTFVEKMENVDFKEAMKILAAKAGVELPEYRPKDPRQAAEEDILYRINDFAARFYHQVLLKDKRASEARQYVKRRGLSEATVSKWQIGFAPDEFHALEEVLTQKKVGRADMLKAGVSTKNERGQVYDRFRGRVTFPIFDINNRAVGFTARILKSDEKAAKYINSPETRVYSKGKILFGLNFAKNEIRKRDEAVIVEGQMDCISLNQAGFKNVVASSGTALTEEQLQMLGRLTKNLKFCFDADAAGLIATKRAVQMYLGKDFTVRIIDLQGAKDPDELVSKNPAAWEALVKQAPLFLDYYVEKVFSQFNPSSVEQKKHVAAELLPFIKRLTDPVERDHYVQILAGRLGTGEQALKDALAKQPVPKAVSIKGQASIVTVPTLAPSVLEKQVLGAMLLYPGFLKQVLSEGSVEDFEHPLIKALVKPIFEQGSLDAESRDSVLAKEGVFMVESELEELDGNQDALDRELKKFFYQLKLQAIKKGQQRLNAEITRAEQAGQKQQLENLNKQFAQLTLLRIDFERRLS